MKYLAILTAAVALAVSPAAAQTSRPAPPPLEVFGALPAIEALALSPDGSRVALVRRGKGERFLIDANLATGERKIHKLGDAKIRDLLWIDGEHVLFQVSATRRLTGLSRRKRDEAFQATIVNTTTGASKVMFSTMPEFYSIISSQPRMVTTGGKTYVYVENYRLTAQELWGQFNNASYLLRTDPETGKSSIVDDGGGDLDRREALISDWVYRADGQMVARTAIYSPGNRWGLEVWVDGKWKRIMTREYGFGLRPNSAPELIGLGRDGNSVLIWDAVPEDRDTDKPEPRAHYYEVSLTGEVSEPLDPLWGDYQPIFHPATWRLSGFAYRNSGEDEEDTVFYDNLMKAVYANARKAFPDRSIEVSSMAQDPRRMLVTAEGPKDPGSFYFLDLNKGGGFKPIGQRHPEVPDEWIAEQRTITYKAADGLEIEAYLTLPPHREAKDLPLVVLPHGGPQARDYSGFDYWAQALASRGYAVLQPNYRGSDGYGRAFIEKGHGEWGRKMQTDLSDGVRDLARQGLVDAKRVCIAGGSYGGYAALAGATIDREPYRCAASINGVSDLKTMEEYTIESRSRHSASVRYWRTFFGDRDGWADVSPYRQAAKAEIPVLLVHGRDDTVVLVKQSEMMRDALKKAGKPVEYVELSGEDHWLSSEETRLQMLKALVAFLEKHNPAYGD